MCGYSSCLYNSATFTLYEYASGGLLCSLLIGFGSISLILRVILQKRRLQRHIYWRKHRKMTLQLISITSIFYILYLPSVVLATARRLGLPSYIGSEYSRYAPFFANYIIFLFPFACLNSLPKVRTRIRNSLAYFSRRQTRRIDFQKEPSKKIDEAYEFHHRALAIQEKHHPSSHNRIYSVLVQIGQYYLNQHKLDKAIERYSEALV
ncbi:hypothetical protein I4U23_023096 [Adineta vaga]|nr:hypothetical protein I4U23_023096 [Adineta vaga]